MDIKIKNEKSLTKETVQEFLSYMNNEDFKKDFDRKIKAYIKSFFTFKFVMFYRVQGFIENLVCYIMGIVIMMEFSSSIIMYKDYMIYNEGSIRSIIVVLFAVLAQLTLLYFMILGFLKSPKVFKQNLDEFRIDYLKNYYNKKVQKKAKELGVDIEFLYEEDELDGDKSNRK